MDPNKLSKNAHLFAAGISLYVVTVSVNLQVPLYSTYARAGNYGNGFTTVVFAAYISGLLCILTLLGGISDRFGRKPVITLGLISSFSSTLLMTLIPHMKTLLVSRILQGIGVGLCLGSATAYLSENMNTVNPQRAAYVASLTTSFGFATGALLTNLSLLYKFSLSPLSYWAILCLNFLCFIFVIITLRNNIYSPSIKIIRLPIFPTDTLVFHLSIMLAWSVTGIIISMVSLQLAQYNLSQWIGIVIFSAVGTGTFIQPLAQRFPPYQSIRIGCTLILVGYLLLLLGIYSSSVVFVILGSVMAGSSCYGFTYLGGLAAITINSKSQEKSRAVSGFFLFAYIGFSLPSVVVGFVSDLIGINYSLSLFGIVVLFSTITLLFHLRTKESFKFKK